jgi:hypothetical protein
VIVEQPARITDQRRHHPNQPTGVRATQQVHTLVEPVGIEYDPKPPHGGIQWSTVDRDIYALVLAQQLPATWPTSRSCCVD